MKKILFILLIILYLMMFITLQVMPADVYGRELSWDPGIKGGIPYIVNSVNIMDFGAAADGVTDDAGALQQAIDAAESPGAVLIPSGTYLLQSTIELKQGVVLRGQGKSETHLLVDHADNAFEIITYKRGTFVNVTGGNQKGSTVIEVDDPSEFQAGLYAEIQMTNDPDKMFTDTAWDVGWAEGARGQISEVVKVEGNFITISEPLRLDFESDWEPVIRKQGFIEHVGFEDFHVKRISDNEGCIFYFKNAAKCWVRNVHSELVSKYHVTTEAVYRLEVRDSYFDDASRWDGGGHGYGVRFSLHTSDSLCVNNIFRHLRHSMVLALGANGNVFAYNYSRDNYQPDPGWTPCDVSFHGHFSFANLIEGNIVQEIDISDHWGPVGPDNVLLRNRVETEDIQVMDQSNGQVVIGNEVINGIVEYDAESVDPSTLILHANYYNGVMNYDPGIDNHDIPVSYLYDSIPGFYTAADLEWPSIGADVLDGTNPAKLVYSGEVNLPPVVEIISPAEGDILPEGDVIIEVNASDFDGMISEVEFYGNIGSTPSLQPVYLGTDYEAPYEFTWEDLEADSYQVFAVAFDDTGMNTESAAVNFTTEYRPPVPEVVITKPGHGDYFLSGSIIEIQAEAFDSAGNPLVVEFFVNDIKIGEDSSEPYTVTWQSDIPGIYNIKASAVNPENAQGVSGDVSINIVDEMPELLKVQYICNNSSDTTNQVRAGFNILNESDNEVDLSSVNIRYYYTLENPAEQEFHCDYAKIGSSNVSGVFQQVSGSDYYVEISFGEVYLAPGAQSGNIQVRCNKTDWSDFYQPDDYSFNADASSYIFNNKVTLYQDGIKVYGSEPGVSAVIPPVVNITSPVDGDVFTAGDNISIAANVSDVDNTVELVEFFVDGSKIGEDTAYPYSCIWENASAGDHIVLVTAVDTDNLSDSDSVSITVEDIVVSDPVVNITSPVDGDVFTVGDVIAITADVYNVDNTVGFVEFFVDGSKIGEDVTVPYSFAWQVTEYGEYIITVSAVDSAGESFESDPAVVIVSNEEPGDLSVVYQCVQNDSQASLIQAKLKVVNSSGTVVPMDELEIRYYFTLEDQADLVFVCDYAVIGTGYVNGDFVNVSGDDFYTSMTFTAGTVPAGGDSGEILVRWSKVNWSMMDQVNDYSFNPDFTDYTLWENICLYRNGELVWGIEP